MLEAEKLPPPARMTNKAGCYHFEQCSNSRKKSLLNSYMKRSSLMVLLFTAPLAVMAQTAVFTDTFGSSTTNKTSTPGGTPTASSTSYDIGSTKAATGGANGPFIGPNQLRISLNGTTTGGFVEAQAVFTATPVSLATIGDYINLTYTFTNTTGSLLAGGSGSYIMQGLYNSGGSVPLAGNLANSGLTSAPSSPLAQGNCANWQGYVSRIANNGASQAYTRPAQTNFTAGPSGDQDLVGNGLGSGAYTNLTGVVFDLNVTNAVNLTSGSTYTISYTIALTAAGTLTVTNNLLDSTGAVIFSQTNTATTTNVLVTSFDGLAIAIRNSGTSFNPVMDISKIAITKSIFGTPGPSFNVTGGGAGCPGSDSFAVNLSSSVTTNVYQLYTNGVFDGAVAAQTGTGSGLTFGPLPVTAVAYTNTILASNTVNGFTGLMSGTAVIAPLAGPAIATQPVAVSVANNYPAVFSVGATGGGLTYQWRRNGTNLPDGGNISGATTPILTVYPATAADAQPTGTGYDVIVFGSCGGLFSTSSRVALTIQSPGNLVWQGGNPNTNWDLATTLNFTNSAGTFVKFNNGDNVAFDDSSANTTVVITSTNSLAPTLVTDKASQNYAFIGSGSISGPGALHMNGLGTLTISNANTYTGGTTISSGILVTKNQSAIGSGTITLAGGKLEVGLASGAAGVGLTNINVTASSTIQNDFGGTFADNLLGTLNGTPGATLTFYGFLNNTATPDRIRIYGAFTNSLNIVIDGNGNQMDLAPYLPSGNQVYNGIISGTKGRFVLRGAGNAIFNNGANTFNDSGVNANGNNGSGYSVLISGSNLGIGADSVSSTPPTIDSSPIGTGRLGINSGPSEGGSASIFASGGAHTIANDVIYTTANTNYTLSFTGSNNLTLSGAFNLNGADNSGGTNRVLQVNNTGLTTLSGVVGDAGLVCGITKTGAGTLALSGVDTYTGPTLVGAGTLWINGQMDVGGVTVTNGALGGTGTILGAVAVQSPGSLSPGTAAIGTLAVNNNLTLGGNALFKVNKSLSPAQSNDFVNVSGVLTNNGTGTLTVTNLGPALVVGDKFKLFSESVSNGTALTVTGAGVNWTNKLAVDGSIQVLSVASSIASYPTNLTFTVGVNTLTINWPATHLGWLLQSQTNALGTGLTVPLNTWYDVSGSDSVTQKLINVNPANPTVFFRLRHP